MAAAISVHNMLQRMGLSLEAATEVVNVNGQNLSILYDFLQLKDKDVESLCQVIRWPKGANAAGNQNQGMKILAMAEVNLKRMCYELHHYTRVSRPVVWADIMLLSICALSVQAEMEASHRDPITLPVMDPNNWTKNFKAIDEHFRGLRGYKKCTLNYVYRPDLVPILAAIDPPTGRVGSLHIYHDDKMCAREGAPSFWLGQSSALTRKTPGLLPQVSLSTGRRCGRSLPRFSSPTMPSRSSRQQRRPEMVDLPTNYCMRTIWGRTMLATWLVKLRPCSTWFNTMARSVSGTSRSMH